VTDMLRAITIDLTAIIVLAGGGVLGAWWLRRSTNVSIRNLYLPTSLLSAGTVAVLAVGMWWVAAVLAPLTAPLLAASLTGRRWRLADLGAGEELRHHELERRWIWQPAPQRADGERVRLLGQGELVRERPWPEDLPYVAMSKEGERAPRVPLGAGQHVMLLGATGSGKTTTARRIIAARTLTQRAAVLVLDQKGDPQDIEQMRRLAAAADVPFILFDSQDPNTDRWAPLWGSPDSVTARAVEPVRQSEPYYYDSLRRHLDLVCKILHASDRWPPSVPFLIDACHPARVETITAIAEALDPTAHAALIRRAVEHAGYVSGSQGQKDLLGGVNRLEVALALAGRQVVTPRITPDGTAVAVSLPQAMRARAVIVWRTHADAMPDEAAALSVLALADIHEAAGIAGVPWTLVLDEFGAVIQTAAQRALAALQRGRSHGGQVIVITQSAADIEALTGQPGLLASLTDNFAAIIAHRQTAPESRDWLAKLMGTRAIWQHTNQTSGHGAQHSGQGSARRVREFRVSSDTFGALRRGEAVIYTPIAGEPTRHTITPIDLPSITARGSDHGEERAVSEIALHPEDHLSAASHAPARTLPTSPPDDGGPDKI
jgi:hypothetical protein